MSDCAFCEQGVRPFYTLDADAASAVICHTCFHLGKHKQTAKSAPSTPPKSSPVKDQSSTGKR
jgi:ribosome-binding protein aMBF1 (putative translation factor)